MIYRHIFYYCLFLCTFILMAEGQAKESDLIATQYDIESQTTLSQKVYIDPSLIYFFNNQIFVPTPKGFVEIDQINSDEYGIYYKTAHPYSWYCDNRLSDGTKCGYYNTNTYYCEHCGRPPLNK